MGKELETGKRKGKERKGMMGKGVMKKCFGLLEKCERGNQKENILDCFKKRKWESKGEI